MIHEMDDKQKLALFVSAQKRMESVFGADWPNLGVTNFGSSGEAETETLTVEVDGDTIDVLDIRHGPLVNFLEGCQRSSSLKRREYEFEQAYGHLMSFQAFYATASQAVAQPPMTQPKTRRNDNALERQGWEGAIRAIWTQGGRSLFGALTSAFSTVKLEICSAQVGDDSLRSVGGNVLEARAVGSNLEIALSEEQYIRLLRSESCEMPCTIQRSYGYIWDEPGAAKGDDGDESQALKHSIQQRLDPLLKPITESVSELLTHASPDSLKSKKRIQQAIDKVDETLSLIDSMIDEVEDTQSQVCSEIRDQARERFLNMVWDDIKHLPESSQQKMLSHISNNF